MNELSSCFFFPGKFVSSIINLVLKKECVFTRTTLPNKCRVPQIRPRAQYELRFEIVFEKVGNFFMRTNWPFLELNLVVLIKHPFFDPNFVTPSENGFQV